MDKEEVLGVARHLATAVGVLLTSFGIVSAEEATTITNAALTVLGSAITIGSIVASVRQKRKASK